MKPDSGETGKIMSSFPSIPILSWSGHPSPLSARLGHPLFGIPGQDRPGDVHPVSGKPLVSASSHAVIGLEMGDHRLDSRPGGDQPLEPPGVFQRSPGFSLFGNGHLGDPGESRRRILVLGSVPPICRKLLRQGTGRLLPSGKDVFQRRGVVPVVGILGMGHHHSILVNRQRDLDPVLVGLARLVLGDAGDLRLMNAIDPFFCRTISEAVLRLGHDLFQDLDLLLEDFLDPDQGTSDGWLCSDRKASKTLSDLPADASDSSERVLSHGRKLLRRLLGLLLLVASELRGRQNDLLAHPDKGAKGPGDRDSQRLGLLNQPEHPRSGLLKQSYVCRVGDVLLHRRSIDAHDLAPDRPGLEHLVPDDRFHRLRSLWPETLPKLAQRGGLDVLGFVCRDSAKSHPHKVLMNFRHHRFVREVEPVLQDHKSHHEPCRLGRPSLPGGIVRRQNLVDRRPVDLLRKLHQGMLRVHMPVVDPLEQALLGTGRFRHGASSRKEGEKSFVFKRNNNLTIFICQ